MDVTLLDLKRLGLRNQVLEKLHIARDIGRMGQLGDGFANQFRRIISEHFAECLVGKNDFAF